MENDKVTSNSLKQLEQILAKKQEYTTRVTKQKRRDLDDNPTMDNIHRVLQTLIEDLKNQGILK